MCVHLLSSSWVVELVLCGLFPCFLNGAGCNSSNKPELQWQKLAPGTYKYKFIVDGVWQHSPDCPSVPDNNGGFNNEITVTG